MKSEKNSNSSHSLMTILSGLLLLFKSILEFSSLPYHLVIDALNNGKFNGIQINHNRHIINKERFKLHNIRIWKIFFFFDFKRCY